MFLTCDFVLKKENLRTEQLTETRLTEEDGWIKTNFINWMIPQESFVKKWEDYRANRFNPNPKMKKWNACNKETIDVVQRELQFGN